MITTTRIRIGAVAAMLALLVTGCAQSPEAAPATPEVPELQQQVVDAFAAEAEELGVIGAFLLVRSPEGEFSAAYGTTERGTETPPTADTVFRIGSNTKTMTGTVILQLVDEGMLSLDDTVSKYLDGVPNGDEITLAMLLSMRSGLPNYTDSAGFDAAIEADPERVWQPQEMLDMAFQSEPLFDPGSEYSYSNTNTVLLALIAEQVTGTNYEQLISDRLMQPLGLTHTLVPRADEAGLAEPFSHGYTYIDENTDPLDVTFMSPSWASAAGAGVSTANELAAWVEALTGGELLSADLQAERMASIQPIPGAPDATGWGYGLGIAKLHGLLGHNGELPGFNSFMGVDPERELTVVMWANLAPGADGKGPADQLASVVVPMLLGGE